ncbi:hypothetical protein [Enterovibrio norvegicus]|uniref:hypothetical protein n=1 Tax=Enterovibrio norvegicus TaxID=188144 RepID=UPI0035541E10
MFELDKSQTRLVSGAGSWAAKEEGGLEDQILVIVTLYSPIVVQAVLMLAVVAVKKVPMVLSLTHTNKC